MTIVNLDSIFPKEITKQSPQYSCERDSFLTGEMWEESGPPGENDIIEAIANYFDACVSYEHVERMIEGGLEIEIVAYDDYNIEEAGYFFSELARRRIRLSLNVEVLDDQQGEG